MVISTTCGYFITVSGRIGTLCLANSAQCLMSSDDKIMMEEHISEGALESAVMEGRQPCAVGPPFIDIKPPTCFSIPPGRG